MMMKKILVIIALSLSTAGHARADAKTSAVSIVSADGKAIAGASVVINGKEVGTLPTEIQLQPGRYLVEVERSGFKTWRTWLDVKSGQPSKLSVTFAPRLAQKTPKGGTLLVAADVLTADVWIDGKARGKVPLLLADLAPKKYQVTVKATGFAPKSQQVEVVAGKTTRLSVALRADKAATLKVLAEPSDVTISLDGKPRGVAPLTLHGLAAGQHVVEGSRDGYVTARREVSLTTGKVTTVKLVLEEPPANRPTGALRVTANTAQALVAIDGRFVGKTPLLRKGVVVGPHLVTVRKEGHAQFIVTVNVKANKIAAVEATLEKSQSVASSQPASQPASSPSKKRVEDAVNQMFSRSAQLMAPAFVGGEFSLGFPHLIEFRLTTGFYRAGRIAIDGGVSLRSFFSITEASLHARVRLLDKDPFWVATQIEIGGGGGPASRNTFSMRIGGLASWRPSKWTMLTGRALLQIYTDRLCPESPRTNEASGCTTPPGGLNANDVRSRFTSAGLLIALGIEVPVMPWLSVFGELEFSAAANRRAYTDAFVGYMPNSDPHVYGRVGVTLRR
jgi:hypothetical protein